MREIIFRAIDFDSGEFVYGDLTTARIKDKIRHFIEDEKLKHTILEETIGQYTGLKDINRREIYEGDIVELTELQYEDGTYPLTGVVRMGVYEHSACDEYECENYGWYIDCGKSISGGCSCKSLKILGNKMVVVGNYYQNKDMLIRKSKNE